MTTSEARRLIGKLKEKTGVAKSEEIIHEALSFYDWVIQSQEDGDSIFMERDGCLEDILVLYKRSQETEDAA